MIKLTPQLWVINPVHKDAICSIELTFNIRHGNTTLPSEALEFLGECKGLQHLSLVMDVDTATCRKSWVVLQPGNYYRTTCYEVPSTILTKVEEWNALRAIKGLLSFEFRIAVTNPPYGGYPPWSIRAEAPAKPGCRERYLQLQDELRRVILKK